MSVSYCHTLSFINFQSLKEYVESKEFRSVMTGPESKKEKKKVCEMLREF